MHGAAARRPPAAGGGQNTSADKYPVTIKDRRHEAASAYKTCDGDVNAAIRRLRTKFPHWRQPQFKRFVQKWGERWVADHVLKRKPGSGRRHKVPAAVAQQCVDEFVAGQMVNGTLRPYESFGEAVAAQPLLKATLLQYKCSRRTLFRAMKRLEPRLKWVMQHRKKITKEHKKKRVSVAMELSSV